MKWEQAQNAGAALNRLDLTRQSYSQRNAVVGSTFTAFASGTIQAASAAPITITAVQIKVIGSVACTPNNRVGKVLDSTRERATAHNTPMVSPIITTLITWETTSLKTSIARNSFGRSRMRCVHDRIASQTPRCSGDGALREGS